MQTGVGSYGKVLATVVLLLAAPFAWVPMIFDKTATLLASGYPLLATIYGLTGLLCVVAVAGAPFVRAALIRWPLVLIILVGFGADLIARQVMGQPLSSHMLGTLVQARHFYRNALGAYGWPLWGGLAGTVALAVPLLTAPAGRWRGLGAWFAIVPLVAWVSTATVIGYLSGRVEELPAPIAAPVQLYVGAREVRVYAGPRAPVQYGGVLASRTEKIVFVVDEGVRGDYLQLNNASFDNTPFLASQDTLANFGLASSFSNCSDTSRAMLRSGARASDLPDAAQRVLRRPSFWQYAKNAGYRTVHIDAWEPRHPMANMQTYDELRYIDVKRSVPLTPYWDIDNKVADTLVEEIHRPGASFVFVEKMGVHAPYDENVPPDAYTPRYLPHRELDEARRRQVRDYVVAIRSRVDRFFERVLPALDQPGVLLVYTSDHGQSMFDGGYDLTACSGPNAVRGEGVVPLFVFSGDETARRDFAAAAASGFNRAAAEDIFPTLLGAMGYAASRVHPAYSDDLLHVAPNRSRKFFVFSPFSTSLQWVSVEPLP